MATYSDRKRDLIFQDQKVLNQKQYYLGGLLSDRNSPPSSIVGRQRTMSWDNTNWRALKDLQRSVSDGEVKIPIERQNQLRMQDYGSPFTTSKNEYRDNSRVITSTNSAGAWDYAQSGPHYAYSDVVGPGSAVWPVISDASLYNEMLAIGTTAIARTIPTNPAANVAQFLGELREGLPKVPGANLIGKKGTPGSFADEYLNYQFGISPLLKDFREIGKAVQNAEKRLAQLRRDSGRLVRRRLEFPVVRTVDPLQTVSTNWFGAPSRSVTGASAGAYSRGGTLTKERVTETRAWFSGSYTYFYTEGSRVLDRLRRAEQGARAVLGAGLTPELLWELMPWSWAVDWVSNMGDVIHNLSMFTRDGLVMPWGYVMCTRTITDTYRLSGLSFDGDGPKDIDTFQSFSTTVKKRVKATPYGFGLDTGSFTSRQWAILGALGVSRAQRML